ncbi:hypothetical protein CRYUN_Cryun33cG0012500 [Craigia yunnanensis]
MTLQLGFAGVFFAIFFLLVSLAGVHNAKTFNVRTYSAVADGRTDNRKSYPPRNTKIDIYVYCGPGHGISVGSLGKFKGEDNVEGLVVRKCTSNGTDNGVRIKTWESPWKSKASNFIFEDIFMDKVTNPVIVDQTYFPQPPCNQQTASHVQIEDVTYRNIWGTSSSQIAVSMQCSKQFPCKNIVMEDINLGHLGREGPLKSWCSYVNGRDYGRQNPPPLLLVLLLQHFHFKISAFMTSLLITLYM